MFGSESRKPHFRVLLIWQLSSSCSLGRPATSVSRDARSHWHTSPEKLTAWTVKHATLVRLHTERQFAFSYQNSTSTFIISSAADPTCYKHIKLEIHKLRSKKKCFIQYESSSFFFCRHTFLGVRQHILFLCGFDLNLRCHIDGCKLKLLLELSLLDSKEKDWMKQRRE